MKRTDPETLLTAWADQPRALTPEERAEVAALVERSPEHRREVDETRELLARVRALPAEGEEPAWDDFARGLRARLDEPRRGWFERWWKPVFGVGGLGLALAAAAIVIVVRREPAATTEPPSPPIALTVDAGAAPPPVHHEADPGDEPLALGAIGAVAPDDLDDGVLEELELDDEDDPDDGLVPDLDLAWIDQLDDDEVDNVDAWLAKM